MLSGTNKLYSAELTWDCKYVQSFVLQTCKSSSVGKLYLQQMHCGIALFRILSIAPLLGRPQTCILRAMIPSQAHWIEIKYKKPVEVTEEVWIVSHLFMTGFLMWATEPKTTPMLIHHSFLERSHHSFISHCAHQSSFVIACNTFSIMRRK